MLFACLLAFGAGTPAQQVPESGEGGWTVPDRRPGDGELCLACGSALFDENAMPPRRETRLASGWLLFGLYVLTGLVFAALCGYIAVGKALAPLPWFFAGLVANVAALGVLLATSRGEAGDLPAGIPAGLAKVPRTRAPRRCPACGGFNHPAAAACGACGTPLVPAAEPETARV